MAKLRVQSPTEAIVDAFCEGVEYVNESSIELLETGHDDQGYYAIFEDEDLKEDQVRTL
jgi:hypothetical protein